MNNKNNSVNKQQYQIQNIQLSSRKYLNIVCGKVIKIDQSTNDTKKPSEEEIKETKMSRKMRSDFNQRNTLLYLHYLLLVIDPTTQIILKSNKRDPMHKRSCFKTFGCESIITNEQYIFHEDIKYKIISDEQKGFHTLELDTATGCPIIDESSNIHYRREIKNRIQQHILIQVINKIFQQMNINELEYYTNNNQKTIVLESLQFDHFYDINIDNWELTQKSKENDIDEYENLCESIFKVIEYFIDKRNGLTKRLIIGDRCIETNGYYVNNECSYIGRYSFFQCIHEVRNNKISVEEFFTQTVSIPVETNEIKDEKKDEMMEEENDDDEYSTGFIQSNL